MRGKRVLLSFTLLLGTFFNIGFANSFAECTPLQNISQVTEENFLNLTSEQMAEDFEYYWLSMKNNSPLFNLTKRYIPDIEKIYEKYKIKILNSNNNFEQVALIDEFSRKFKGHNGVLACKVDWLKKLYSNPNVNRNTWSKVLSNAESERNTDSYNLFKRSKDVSKNQHKPTKNVDENVTTKIINPGKIAYIKVASFGAEHIGSHDEKIISDFFKEVQNYDHLIIDITGNPGGHSGYVKYFKPLLKAAHSIDEYYLFKCGQNSEEYINEAFKNSVKPIKNLPNFSKINSSDKNEMTHYHKSTFKVEPAEQNQFGGKIWLLIDERVFSAAEGFAKLCKDTGEVTLVGRNTRGDGVGIDPAFIVLPNSKIILRYSLIYGLNADGSSNIEFGTTPDIVSPDSENPLETCLKYCA